jgi:hypothetical protein
MLGFFYLMFKSEIKVKSVFLCIFIIYILLNYCKNSLIEYNEINLSTVYKHHQLDDCNGRETKSLEFCIR